MSWFLKRLSLFRVLYTDTTTNHDARYREKEKGPKKGTKKRNKRNIKKKETFLVAKGVRNSRLCLMYHAMALRPNAEMGKREAKN
jgi:hypothetical protein